MNECIASSLLSALLPINNLSSKSKTPFGHYAFHEMGGKLSFAITLLDGNNNGFILNSVHSREGCYNYVKEIVKGESYIELSEEETESLERAIYQETLGFDLDDKR